MINQIILLIERVKNMICKENVPPTKQGVFYQLNLNKNNGPFLAKDIMFNNPKSNDLITNPDILQAHKTMTETLTTMSKTSKQSDHESFKVESFLSTISYCQGELISCFEASKSLTIEEKEFKKSYEHLYQTISQQNNRLMESSMSALKILMKKVKESNLADKAEYYKISKQLQLISLQKKSLETFIRHCKEKIEGLEQRFGISELESRLNYRQNIQIDNGI